MSPSACDEGVDNLFCLASTSNSFGQQTLAHPKANTAALFAYSETAEEFVKAACLYLFLDFSMHASYSRFADVYVTLNVPQSQGTLSTPILISFNAKAWKTFTE